MLREQKKPNGTFPTVPYPNPEDENAWTLAMKLAKEVDADIVLATDPDAVMMLCEVAAYYKKQGKTLWDAMLDMYEKYGCYKEGLATVTLKGIDGSQKIQAMMDDFRQNPPKKLGDFEVLAYRDYKEDVRKDLVTGKSVTRLLRGTP